MNEFVFSFVFKTDNTDFVQFNTTLTTAKEIFKISTGHREFVSSIPSFDMKC